MKYLVGIERNDYISGTIEKEIEATEFIVDEATKVLYLYNSPKIAPVAAFLEWEYVRLADEET